MRARFVVTTALSVVALAMTLPDATYGQQTARRRLDTRSATSRGTGANENIRSDTIVNPVQPSVRAPVAKGGTRTRGAPADCVLHVDNRTAWYIIVYVDGARSGIVGPYGDVYGYFSCDTHVLYARAPLDDGSERTWGPATADITRTFTWRLW
jgi:hypothetical protein